MLKWWPKSLWIQAIISLVGALIASASVFAHENSNLFQQYAKDAPHDGQDGLAALVGAGEAALAAFCGVFLFSLILQRFLTVGLSRSRQ
jgi:hypothetical protein